MVDSWTGHSDADLYRIPRKQVDVHILPKGSTGYIQPLDQMCFHQWKDFVKRFAEHVLHQQIGIDLQQRNTIIKLHSLIFNQFQSPIFYDMFKFAWRMGGFDVENEPFKSLRELLFEFDDYECSERRCGNFPFIKCSHCRNVKCFECFFTNYHHHQMNF